MDVNSAIKISIHLLITIACFAFVFWQSLQCIQKYIAKPQGTKLSLHSASQIHEFPTMTICAYHPYDEDHLKICGVRYCNYILSNLKIF